MAARCSLFVLGANAPRRLSSGVESGAGTSAQTAIFVASSKQAVDTRTDVHSRFTSLSGRTASIARTTARDEFGASISVVKHVRFRR
jgi:hypothetical protein